MFSQVLILSTTKDYLVLLSARVTSPLRPFCVMLLDSQGCWLPMSCSCVQSGFPSSDRTVTAVAGHREFYCEQKITLPPSVRPRLLLDLFVTALFVEQSREQSMVWAPHCKMNSCYWGKAGSYRMASSKKKVELEVCKEVESKRPIIDGGGGNFHSHFITSS